MPGNRFQLRPRFIPAIEWIVDIALDSMGWLDASPWSVRATHEA